MKVHFGAPSSLRYVLTSLRPHLLTTGRGDLLTITKRAVASSGALRCGVDGKAVRSHSICPRPQCAAGSLEASIACHNGDHNGGRQA